MTTIRPAVPGDIPQLCALLHELFTQEADFTPAAEKQARGLHLILDNPAMGRIFCATQADSVVGMAIILFTISTAEGGRAAWLEDMVVHPDWRERHVGRRLLQHAIDEARAAGCTRITLLTDETNQGARRFYSRAGFKPSGMTPFRLSL